jgi:hypothetical protein
MVQVNVTGDHGSLLKKITTCLNQIKIHQKTTTTR